MRRLVTRLAKVLAIFLIVVVAFAYLTADPSLVGHFRSVEGEQAYKRSYAQAMQLLPRPSRTLDIATQYGTVRVYEFVNERANASDATPIVLLPGRTSGVPMWSANLNGLLAARTIYALDALGDAGFSVQTRPIVDSGDQAAWLDQTFAQLGLRQMHLVGHSFGGWLAANYAAHDPQRIKTLSLLEPVLVFQGLRWQVYAVTIPASLPFLPRRWQDAMLQQIGGGGPIDHDDPMTAMIANATAFYAVKLPLPDRLTDDQLRGLSMPVYVAMAAHSFMHDSIAAVAVAKATVPHLTINLWSGATHSLPMEFPQQLNDELLKFWTRW